MKTVLQELIEELKEREAFLEITDCISESLEVEYIITLCEKRLQKEISDLKLCFDRGIYNAISSNENDENRKFPFHNSVSEIVINSKNKPELKVKCLHCGRKFIGKLAHKCNTGYRKRNHNWEEI